MIPSLGEIVFTKPVEAVLVMDMDGVFVTIEELDIHAYGRDMLAAFQDTLDELRFAVREYRDCDPSELHPSALALRAKLEELVE